MSEWKSKIVGHDKVAPDQLLAHPQNWRTHPQSQRDTLKAAIEEVGFIRSVTVNKRTSSEWGDDRYVETLIDGHERVWQALTSEQPLIDVEYVDLTPSEEAMALATIDPIGEMAIPDQAMLNDLLGGVEAQNANLDALLDSLHVEVNEMIETDKQQAEVNEAMELRPHEHYDYIVILADDSSTWNSLCEKLGITIGPLFNGRKKTRLGICRAIKAERVLGLLQDRHSEQGTIEGDLS